MTPSRPLHLVGKERTVEEPSYAYEREERARIAAKDWARVHIEADNRPALPWFERVRRTWRG